MEAAKKAEPGPGARLAIDLGPLLIFFGVNAWFDDVILATGAFMVAMVASMAVSQLKYRHISPMLWFSAVMVVVLGGITIWLHDETFIKIKPTIYYTTVAALLLFGMATKRNLLKTVLGSAYPGLSEKGWQILTRNWAIFFIVMACVNEAVWRTTSTDFWVGFKLWGFLPATFLFALAHIPMLVRHGMELEQGKEEPPVPPSQ
ncbi:MAG TPA: septation protein A [Allosphingosinicella sp.]|uniref:septation protein A n=1 Tax=Allosphingosinicella sp. TaxID=2823234 RepID=UPI002EDAB1C5